MGSRQVPGRCQGGWDSGNKDQECGGNPSGGWKRISRQRVLQKGMHLSTKSRDNEGTSVKPTDLLTGQGESTRHC